MGLLYSDLQVMGSLYVIRSLVSLAHLIAHLGAVQLCSPIFWGAAKLSSHDFPL